MHHKSPPRASAVSTRCEAAVASARPRRLEAITKSPQAARFYAGHAFTAPDTKSNPGGHAPTTSSNKPAARNEVPAKASRRLRRTPASAATPARAASGRARGQFARLDRAEPGRSRPARSSAPPSRRQPRRHGPERKRTGFSRWPQAGLRDVQPPPNKQRPGGGCGTGPRPRHVSAPDHRARTRAGARPITASWTRPQRMHRAGRASRPVDPATFPLAVAIRRQTGGQLDVKKGRPRSCTDRNSA